ncbi:MAG: alanine--tRNA ligase, partial [Bacteroidia bacterium]|nr:alanine--tRNA ligase [Bacteroidia bacterium]
EANKEVDMDGFVKALNSQKERSRAAAVVNTHDWVIVKNDDDVEFTGYECFENDCEILRYRKVNSKNKEQYQLVLNRTPFYAESGGQVGDTGLLIHGDEKIRITDTRKENNLILHFADSLPSMPEATFHAVIDKSRRTMITCNHSATHLMHAALKEVLGSHVNQKGSLVNEEHTRFDFSHFARVTDEELRKIEHIVNTRIRQNIPLEEMRNVPIEEAIKMGATALFGEKYGEYVRVITFDPAFSRELCGGTHVKATGEIGLFRIVSESAVAAGVRRIEAITAEKSDEWVNKQAGELQRLSELLKNPRDIGQKVISLLDENEQLHEQVRILIDEKTQLIKKDLIAKIHEVNGVRVITEQVVLPDTDAIKKISFELKNQVENLFFLAGAEIEGKAHLSLIISDNLVAEKNLNAIAIIRELSKEIQGGGGGQPFYATAGGKNPGGLKSAIDKGKKVVSTQI